MHPYRLSGLRFNHFIYIKKYYKRKLLLSAALAAATLSAAAASPKNAHWVGNLYYDINTETKTAEVVSSAYYSPAHELYSGDVVVPATIVFNSETYTVTSLDE